MQAIHLAINLQTLLEHLAGQVDAAIAASVAVGNNTGGQTFTLTTAQDVIVGTAGNDTIFFGYSGDPDGDRIDSGDTTGIGGTM